MDVTSGSSYQTLQQKKMKNLRWITWCWPRILARLGRIVMAPSAAHSWSRTGCILAPHESDPIQKNFPATPFLTVALNSFLERNPPGLWKENLNYLVLSSSTKRMTAWRQWLVRSALNPILPTFAFSLERRVSTTLSNSWSSAFLLIVIDTPMQMPDFVASWIKEDIPFSPYSPYSF